MCHVDVFQSFATRRSQAYAALQVVHESMYNAGITVLRPLQPDDFILVWQPMTDSEATAAKAKPELLLGRGVSVTIHRLCSDAYSLCSSDNVLKRRRPHCQTWVAAQRR